MRSKERQRALRGAPCAGQGEDQPPRAIAVSTGLNPACQDHSQAGTWALQACPRLPWEVAYGSRLGP